MSCKNWSDSGLWSAWIVIRMIGGARRMVRFKISWCLFHLIMILRSFWFNRSILIIFWPYFLQFPFHFCSVCRPFPAITAISPDSPLVAILFRLKHRHNCSLIRGGGRGGLGKILPRIYLKNPKTLRKIRKFCKIVHCSKKIKNFPFFPPIFPVFSPCACCCSPSPSSALSPSKFGPIGPFWPFCSPMALLLWPYAPVAPVPCRCWSRWRLSMYTVKTRPIQIFWPILWPIHRPMFWHPKSFL